MELKTVPLVVLLLIFSVFLFAHAKNQNLTYVDGYQDGKQAAKADVKNDPNPFFSAKYLSLPQHRLEQIENKSSSYQEGFKEGYREGAKQALTSSPKWWGGFVIGMAAFSLSLVFVLSVTTGL